MSEAAQRGEFPAEGAAVGRKVAFGEAHAYLADGRLAGHATSSPAAIA